MGKAIRGKGIHRRMNKEAKDKQGEKKKGWNENERGRKKKSST